MSSSEDQTRFVSSRLAVVSLVAVAVLALSACASGDKQPPTPPATSESPSSAPATERVVGPLTPADAQALATMNDRLKQYVDLHRKIERSLPKLPKEATPQQIDKNQRVLEKLLRGARGEVTDFSGVGGGIRTLGHWNHNPALYQLSYTHQEGLLNIIK